VLKILNDKIRQGARQIPPEAKRFVIMGAVLLICWCLLYGLLIKPYKLIDPVLTKYTGQTTISLMKWIYTARQPAVIYTPEAALFTIDKKEVLSLGDGCNGLELYVLFTGFIICIPMGVKKMAKYILIGLVSIFILNVARCLALIYLYDHHSGYTGIAHHYFFQLIVYAAIFFVWERYFRSLQIGHEISEV